MGLRLTKKWHYIVFSIIWLLGMLLGLYVYFDLMKYDYEVREVVKFSQLFVCTKDGEPVRNTSDVEVSRLFQVPGEMERIYICGSVETPRAILLSIDLKVIENGDEQVIFHKVLPEPLRTGSFVFDLIATDRLNSGQYLAKLTIGRIEKEGVRFRIEK